MITNNTEFYNAVLNGYQSLLAAALPVAFFIAACNVGFNVLISAFSGGKLRFGRGD